MFSIHLPSYPLKLVSRIGPFYVIHRFQSSAAHGLQAVTSRFSQQKIGKRGGQNLSNRDIRLAKSIRQKQAFARVSVSENHALDPSSPKDESIAQRRQIDVPVSSIGTKPPTKTFKGMIIPQKPRPPESDECCMSGCAICVYDLYLTSLESHREAISNMRSALRAQDVPIAEWPNEIKGQDMRDTASSTDSELNVSMSAFAALERSLREGKGI